LATAACVWFHAVGFQPATLWQVVQLATVGMWMPDLPVAPLPLWQLAQLVAVVNELWSMLATGNHATVVLWQLSQEACVWICPDGLPGATVPL
jgi:hypothetical protein